MASFWYMSPLCYIVVASCSSSQYFSVFSCFSVQGARTAPSVVVTRGLQQGELLFRYYTWGKFVSLHLQFKHSPVHVFGFLIELISDKVAGPTLVVSSSYKDFQISNREISQERGMWNHRPVVDGYKLSASCESGYSEKWVLWFSKSEKSHTLVPRWPQLWRRRHWSTAPLWRPDPLRRHGETFHLTRNKHWDTPQSSSSDRKYRAYRRGWCSWCFCWSRFWHWRALWWSHRGSKSGESQRKHVIFL